MFNLSASTTASEICNSVQVGINDNILHWKYQLQPHSLSLFSSVKSSSLLAENNSFCSN